MHVLILYDSRFGNTERLATAMEGAISARHEVVTRQVVDAPREAAGYDLVLVGGPTHIHGASQPLRDALHQLPKGSLTDVPVAVFDTRYRAPRVLTGSAGNAVVKLLRRAGADVVDEPVSFFVNRKDPPTLDPGEEARAQAWAREMVARLDSHWTVPV